MRIIQLKKINKMRNMKIEAILARLKLVFNVSSDTALARALQTTPQTISSWRSRGNIPYSVCVNAAVGQGFTLDWLLMGREPAHYVRGAGTAETIEGERLQLVELSPREQATLELFKGLTEEEQQDVYQIIREKSRLHSMEQRLQDLQRQLEASKSLN